MVDQHENQCNSKINSNTAASSKSRVFELEFCHVRRSSSRIQFRIRIAGNCFNRCSKSLLGWQELESVDRGREGTHLTKALKSQDGPPPGTNAVYKYYGKGNEKPTISVEKTTRGEKGGGDLGGRAEGTF